MASGGKRTGKKPTRTQHPTSQEDDPYSLLAAFWRQEPICRRGVAASNYQRESYTQKKRLQRTEGHSQPAILDPHPTEPLRHVRLAAPPAENASPAFPESKRREATWDDSNLSCSICFEEFRTPKVLSCGHTFCVHCTDNMVDRNGFAPTLQCPTCREDVIFPESGRTEDLVTNVHLVSMINDRKGSTTDDGTKRNQCEVHGLENKLYCQSCRTPVCLNCTLGEHEVGEHNIITKKNFLGEQRRKVEGLNERLPDLTATCARLETEFNQRRRKYTQEISDLERQVQSALEDKQKHLAEDAAALLEKITESTAEPERENQQFEDRLSQQRESLERAKGDTADLVRDLDAQNFADGAKINGIAESSTEIGESLEKLEADFQHLTPRVNMIFEPSSHRARVGHISSANEEPEALPYIVLYEDEWPISPIGCSPSGPGIDYASIRPSANSSVDNREIPD